VAFRPFRLAFEAHRPASSQDLSMNIYVSNISYTATDEALQAAFAVYGEVTSARIIKDRLTSRSRGFGFVEMTNDEEGKKALEALAGADLMGRAISVREARPREEGEKKGGQGEGGEPRPPREPREARGERGDRGNNNGGQRNNNNGRNREPREPREPREAQPQAELVIIQRGMY
jgi:RNA recognition motif-containing protein